MNKPSDMPHRRLEVARTATAENYNALTEITLDRFDDERNI